MAPVTQDWTRWTYYDWNRQLAQYFLAARTPEERIIAIERIASTTEELARVAGVDRSHAPAVAEAFVGRVRQLKPGQGFCDYCLGYQSDSDDEYPPFFAMLWFTCLIAYGHPEGGGGSFSQRLTKALGKSENFNTPGADSSCLPTLWERVAQWSEERQRNGANIRRLVLPVNVGHRTVIGYSHFLAFPNRFDRAKLAVLLREADFVGAEPPIRLLVDTLLRNRRIFSDEFREDLQDFLEEYRRGLRDPRENAFWRAIRQEAMSPSEPAESEASAVGSFVLVLRTMLSCPVLGFVSIAAAASFVELSTAVLQFASSSAYAAADCRAGASVADETSASTPVSFTSTNNTSLRAARRRHARLRCLRGRFATPFFIDLIKSVRWMMRMAESSSTSPQLTSSVHSTASSLLQQQMPPIIIDGLAIDNGIPDRSVVPTNNTRRRCTCS